MALVNLPPVAIPEKDSRATITALCEIAELPSSGTPAERQVNAKVGLGIVVRGAVNQRKINAQAEAARSEPVEPIT